MCGLIRILLFTFISLNVCLKAKPVDIGKLYASIGERLASIKKQAPACASIIGLVMDDFDLMYEASRVSQQQERDVMKELEKQTIENARLREELASTKAKNEILKQVAEEAQRKIDDLAKESEKVRTQVASLKEQNTLLQKKTGSPQDLISAEIDKQFAGGVQDPVSLQGQNKNQNLSLSSTSEPSSPR